MTLLLIAETPRASDEGHRFLIPDGSSLPESLLGAFTRVAYEDRDGGNYLGASRQATQAFANGTVRAGNEVLVLVGVDVARLTAPEVLSAQKWLRTKLASLGEVGTSQSSHRLVIGWPTFNQWLKDPQLAQLPTTEWERGPRELQSTQIPTSSHSRHRKTIALGLLASHLVMLLFGGLAVISFPTVRRRVHEKPPEASRQPPEVTGSPSATDVRKTRPYGSLPPPGLDVAQSWTPQSSAKAEFQRVAACLDESTRTKLLDLFDLFLEKRSESSANDLVYDLIDAVDDLNRAGRHGEAARLIQPVLTLPLPDPLRESLAARLRETDNAVDDKDRAMYEKIREADVAEREDRIVNYLKTAPRKYMAAEVERYRAWLKTAPTIELLEIQPPESHPATGLCSVTVQVGERSFTFHRVPTAERLAPEHYRVDLGALEGAPWNKQIELKVSLDNHSSAFIGTWRLMLDAQSDGQRVALTSQSGFVGSQELHVRLRVPELANLPALPPWAEKRDE